MRDIHAPPGNNDHLADGFATERSFYRIEAQNGSLDFRILGIATPFLAKKQTNGLLFSLLVLFNSFGRERAIVRQWLVALIVWISECVTVKRPCFFLATTSTRLFSVVSIAQNSTAHQCNKFGQLGSLFAGGMNLRDADERLCGD
jgi:hypothetical protein